MAEHPRDAVGPMNSTINDMMGKPVIADPIPELIINGSAVWEDVEEIEAQSLERETTEAEGQDEPGDVPVEEQAAEE